MNDDLAHKVNDLSLRLSPEDGAILDALLEELRGLHTEVHSLNTSINTLRGEIISLRDVLAEAHYALGTERIRLENIVQNAKEATEVPSYLQHEWINAIVQCLNVQEVDQDIRQLVPALQRSLEVAGYKVVSSYDHYTDIIHQLQGAV